MRSSTTYRAARRNTLNEHGKRSLNKQFQRLEGGVKRQETDSLVTMKMYHPPVRENARVRGENRDEILAVRSVPVSV